MKLHVFDLSIAGYVVQRGLHGLYETRLTALIYHVCITSLPIFKWKQTTLDMTFGVFYLVSWSSDSQT